MNAHDHQTHKYFPERLAFTLDNRVRRFLQPPEQLISKLSLRPSDVVVDFGCGAGFYTIPLARVAAKTIAVDVSSRMLDKTAANAKKSGVTIELMKSDGTQITLADKSVDLIFLNHVFHEIDDRPRALGEFLRILKRSGRLAIVEKTRGGRVFGQRLGPPIIDPETVVQETERAGFVLAEKIEHGNDCVIVGRRP